MKKKQQGEGEIEPQVRTYQAQPRLTKAQLYKIEEKLTETLTKKFADQLMSAKREAGYRTIEQGAYQDVLSQPKKQLSEDQIQQYKDLIEMYKKQGIEVQEMYQKKLETLQQEKDSEKKFFGQPIQSLAKIWDGDDQGLKKQLKELTDKVEEISKPFKGVSGQQLGLTNQQQYNEFETARKNVATGLIPYDIAKAITTDKEYTRLGDLEKMQYRTMFNEKNWKQVATALGFKAGSLSHRQFLALAAIDDWHDVWQKIKDFGGLAIKTLLPMLIQKYAPQLTQQLGLKVAGSLLDNVGADEGIDYRDFADKNMAFDKFIMSTPNSGNVFAGNVTSYQMNPQMSLSQGINWKYICSEILPLMFNERMPSNYLAKTALAKAKTPIPLTSDAAGNFLLFVFLSNLYNTAGNGVMYAALLSGWNTNTGTWVGVTYQIGPLNGQATTCERARIGGAECVVVPSQGLNNGGTFYNAYFASEINPSCVGTLALGSYQVPLSQVEQIDSCVVTNSLTQSRTIRWKRDPSEDLMSEVAGIQNNWVDTSRGFIVTGVGFPPNTTVATANIVENIEFVPTGSATQICPQESAQPGPETQCFLAAMQSQFKSLLTMSWGDARKLVGALAAREPTTYNQAREVFAEVMGGLVPNTEQSVAMALAHSSLRKAINVGNNNQNQNQYFGQSQNQGQNQNGGYQSDMSFEEFKS